MDRVLLTTVGSERLWQALEHLKVVIRRDGIDELLALA